MWLALSHYPEELHQAQDRGVLKSPGQPSGGQSGFLRPAGRGVVVEEVRGPDRDPERADLEGDRPRLCRAR